MKIKACIAAFVTVFLMCTFLLLHSFASTDDGIRQERLLNDLNILPQQSKGEVYTRGEFAAALSKLIIVDFSKHKDVPFTDVTKDMASFDGIKTLYASGVISGSEFFYPDRLITYEEAVKCVVSLLGYDRISQYRGGWPTGYLATGADIGITDGVNTDITYDSVCTLMYNALNARLPYIRIVNDEFIYTINGGNTYIKEVFHINSITGTFTAAQYYGGEGGNGVGEGKTQIDSTVLRSGEYDTDMFYAQYVDVYYDGDFNIVSMYVYDELSNDIVIISSDDDAHYQNLTYTVTDAYGKVKKYEISSNALIVKNGKRAVYNAEDMLPRYGSVKLIRNGGSGVYDTIITENYVQLVAGAINTDDFSVTDLEHSVDAVNLDSTLKNVSITDQNGRKADFSDIKKYDVLWVGQSDDCSVVKVILTKDILTGVITGFSDEEIYIDGSAFSAQSAIVKKVRDNGLVGRLAECSFNINREIVYIKSVVSEDSSKIGYLIRSKDTSAALESKYSVKILTSDGAIKVYDMAKVISINGVAYKDNYYPFLPKSTSILDSLPPGIIQYTVSKNGEITSINFAAEVSEAFGGTYNPITKNAYIGMYVSGTTEDEYIQYKQYNNMIVGLNPGRIFVTSNAIQFIVPRPEDTSDASDKDYSVKLMSEYADNDKLTMYNHTGYTNSTDSSKSQYIVSEYNLASGGGSAASSNGISDIVTSVSRVLDDDSMPAYKVSFGMSNYVYLEDDTLLNEIGIREGDYIKVTKDKNNYATGMSVYYREGDDTFINIGNSGYQMTNSGTILSTNPGMHTLSENMMLLGRVYNKFSDVMYVLPMNIAPEAYSNGNDLYAYSLKSATVYLYDSKLKTLTKVDTSYLKDYLSFGAKGCSKIIVTSHSGNTGGIYIYK